MVAFSTPGMTYQKAYARFDGPLGGVVVDTPSLCHRFGRVNNHRAKPEQTELFARWDDPLSKNNADGSGTMLETGSLEGHLLDVYQEMLSEGQSGTSDDTRSTLDCQ